MTREVPDHLLADFTQQEVNRADGVRRFLASLTDRERALVRDAAVMGWVQGALEPKDARIPKDSVTMATVIAECLHFPDKFRAFGLVAAGQWSVQSTDAPSPRRGDTFERWLKEQRDLCEGHASTWNAVDGLLDQYRLHADTGTPLDEHVCEGKAVGDCGCMEMPVEAPRQQSETGRKS